MNISIKPLMPGMSGEFFRYFEESAFPPGDPRANCYCLESHIPEEYPFTNRDYPWQYRSTVGQYERLGFTLFAECPGFCIYRRELLREVKREREG